MHRASRERGKLVTLVQLFFSNKRKKQNKPKASEELLVGGGGSRTGKPRGTVWGALALHLESEGLQAEGLRAALTQAAMAHKHQLSTPVCQAPLEARGPRWEPDRPKLAPWR